MKILLAGGGSGGHLTPLLAVADALHNEHQVEHVYHIGQKGEQLDDVMQHHHITESLGIQAGKFRRYHSESKLKQLLDVKTMALNIRDVFRFMIGTVQAWRVLGRLRPDAILLKGGYVCVPVGYAARLRGIPYITHDSDAIPGLANRLTAKHATYNAVAMPVDGYPYAKDKVVQTGIPIRPEFVPVSDDMQRRAKEKLGYSATDTLIFVVGGGLGARNVNKAVADVIERVIERHDKVKLIQITGKKLHDETAQMYETKPPTVRESVALIDFTSDIHEFMAAADITISRAGATNMAEFAVQEKAVIFIPNPVLTGGQQLHNAEIVSKADAGVIVNEGDTEGLLEAILKMFSMKKSQKKQLGRALNSVIPAKDAAQTIAGLLMDTARQNNVQHEAK